MASASRISRTACTCGRIRPLGRARVDRRDEQHGVARLDQSAQKRQIRIHGALDKPDDGLTQRVDPEAFFGADRHGFVPEGAHLFFTGGPFLFVGRVGFVQNDDGGRGRFLNRFDEVEFVLGKTFGAADDERHVHPAQNREAALDAQLTEFARVVDTRRVDEDHRPDRRELAGFFHRVGRRARHIADDGDFLIGQGVDKRALAGVAATEKTDVKTQSLGSLHAGSNAENRCGHDETAEKKVRGKTLILKSPDTKKSRPTVFSFGRDFCGDRADPLRAGLRGRHRYFSMLVRTTSFSSHTGEWCSAASQLMSPVPMRQMPRK